MRNDTRLHYNKLMEQIAKLNCIAPRRAYVRKRTLKHALHAVCLCDLVLFCQRNSFQFFVEKFLKLLAQHRHACPAALKNDAPLARYVHLGNGDGRKQGLRIRVLRVLENEPARSRLDDLAVLHDDDPLGALGRLPRRRQPGPLRLERGQRLPQGKGAGNNGRHHGRRTSARERVAS